MKIGIIIHSQTGNTRLVAEKLMRKLQAGGYAVNLEQMIPINEKEAKAEAIQFKQMPDINSYDIVIFGAPVRGGAVSPAFSAFMAKVGSLKDKKISCFTTQFFPYPWMGGNRAIEQMKRLCETKEGTVSKTGIVNWKNKRREEMITDLVEELSII